METIVLYASRINQMGDKLSAARKSVDNFRTDLLKLSGGLKKVDENICDLENEIEKIRSSSDTQSLKSSALDSMEKATEDFIDFADRVDCKAAEYISKASEDFYRKYSWLKPENENSIWQWAIDGYKKAKEYFKSVYNMVEEFYKVKVLGTVTDLITEISEALGFVKSKIEQFTAPLKQFIEYIKEDIANFNWMNTDEKIVTDSHYFSAYKGTLVCRHSIPGCSSCSLGIIFLNTNDKRSETVQHEYGHTVQLEQLGLLRYILFIAIPSLNGYINNVSEADYYNQLWERSAEYYGSVNRKGYRYYTSVQDSLDYLQNAQRPFLELFAEAFKKKWTEISQRKAGIAG